MTILTTEYMDINAVPNYTSANTPGFKTLAIPGDNWSELLTILSDPARNRFYLCGTTHQGSPLSIPFVSSQFQFRPFIFAVDPHGVADPAFNSGTPLVLPMGLGSTTGTDSECTDGFVDSTGLITLGCTFNTSNVTVGQGAVVQINPDGTLHTGFNGTGFKTYIQSGSSAALDVVRVLVQQLGANAGKPIIGIPQDLGSGNVRLLIARFSTAGVLDTAGFNASNGFQASQFVGTKPTRLGALILDSTDNIYVGCGNDAVTGQTGGFFVERYGPNGAPLTAFGGLGDNSNGARATFSQAGTASVSSLRLDHAGRLLVVGQSPYDGSGHGQVQFAWMDPVTGALVSGVGPGGESAFDYHLTLQPTSGPSGALELAAGDLVIAGASVGAIPGQGFSDGGVYLNARYTPGNPTVQVWQNTLPSITSSSKTWYSIGAMGYPATAPTYYLAGGHTTNDVASPRRAVAFAAKFDLTGALLIDFG